MMKPVEADTRDLSLGIAQRESVHFIRKMMQLAPDIVHIHSMENQRIVYANHRLEEVLGYTPEHLADMGHSLLPAVVSVDPDQLDAWVRNQYAQATDGQIVEYELTMRHRDGSLRIIRTRGSVFRRDASGQPIEVMGISEDVTAERRAEEELRRSEFLTRRIVELCPDIIGIYDVSRQTTQYVGKSLWEILGYRADEARELNLSMGNFFWDEAERLRVVERLEEMKRLPDQATHAFKTRMRHRTGELVQVFVRGMVFQRQPDGTATELIAFYQDATEQERATEQLRAQKDKLLEAERNFQYGSWEWELGTDYVCWSEGMFNLYGLALADFPDRRVSGSFFQQLISPDDWKAIIDSMQQAVRTGQSYQLEHGLPGTSGGPGRRMLVRGKVVHDGDGTILKVIGTTADITVLHQYEAELARRIEELDHANHELRHSEALLAQTEKVLKFGSWEWDIRSNQVYWSEGHYQLFGYPNPATRPVELSLELHLSHFVDATEAESTREKTHQALETGEGFEYTHGIRGADGVERYLQGRIVVERDETGQISKLMGSTTDMTELREYQTQLQEKIDALNRSNHELEQFAYVASHDLQEPLRKITAFGERLTARLGDQLGPDGTLYLGRMLDAADRMRVLINDLLNFSRLARQNEPFLSTDLNEIFRSVLGDLEIKIQEKKADIDWPPLPRIDAVPSQMRQLFQNLISNALKFAPAGVPPRIQIGVESISGLERTKFGLDPSRPYVALTFQDQGIGFEPEFAERIFVLFQRLHGRSEYEGTGIGLAICRKIVDHHQGRIFAESAPDQGARFTIILPVHH